MNYKTLIAFLGKNQMKDWAKPVSRLVMFSDDQNGPKTTWKSLVEAFPDKFILDGSYLKTHDGGRYKWFRIRNKHITYMGRGISLGQESNIYIYDPETNSIFFNNDEKTEDELENIFPQMEEIASSGGAEIQIK
jgi:hypothetical protein